MMLRVKIQLILLILLVIFALSFFSLGWGKFFLPKYENMRREVFESTRSYNQAKVQELGKYKLEYDRASEEDKTAIASAIRHRFADYDDNKLDYQLKSFLQKIRGY